MFRQRLLVIWASYRLHHLLRVAAEVSLSVVVFSGAVTTVVTVAPIHHRRNPVPSGPTVSTPKPTPKPVAKKPPTQVAPPPVQTPAPTPPASKPAVTTPTPTPIASSQPSPGTGVQQLVPTPASGTSTPQTTSSTIPSTSTTSPSTGSSGSTSTTSTVPAAATGGYYSTNWSGYAALSGKFTAVSGSWTVPVVTGNGKDTTGDAAWVGIGGVSSNDLIQAGTMDMVAPDGSVTISAFYELLPDAAMEITAFKIQAGDVMTVSISQLPSGKWSVSISDTTTGQTYSTVLDYTSSYSSAEWIEEDPSYANGSLVPFDSFDHVVFSNGSTTMNGTAANIAGSQAEPLTLVDSTDKPIVTPSVLIDSGSGFWAMHD